MALTFSNRIYAEWELDQETSSMVRAVETQLLSWGCTDFASIVRCEAPSLFDGPILVLDNGMRYFSLELIFAERRRKEENERIRAARKQVVRNILYMVQLLRFHEQVLEGGLREDHKSVLVGNRVEERIGDRELKLFSVRLEHVRKLLDVIREEWGTMSEVDVVREMKRVTGL